MKSIALCGLSTLFMFISETANAVFYIELNNNINNIINNVFFIIYAQRKIQIKRLLSTFNI